MFAFQWHPKSRQNSGTSEYQTCTVLRRSRFPMFGIWIPAVVYYSNTRHMFITWIPDKSFILDITVFKIKILEKIIFQMETRGNLRERKSQTRRKIRSEKKYKFILKWKDKRSKMTLRISAACIHSEKY